MLSTFIKIIVKNPLNVQYNLYIRTTQIVALSKSFTDMTETIIHVHPDSHSIARPKESEGYYTSPESIPVIMDRIHQAEMNAIRLERC